LDHSTWELPDDVKLPTFQVAEQPAADPDAIVCTVRLYPQVYRTQWYGVFRLDDDALGKDK
jgi:hypothetical protein